MSTKSRFKIFIRGVGNVITILHVAIGHKAAEKETVLGSCQSFIVKFTARHLESAGATYGAQLDLFIFS